MFAWFANTYNYSTYHMSYKDMVGLHGLLIRIITQLIFILLT